MLRAHEFLECPLCRFIIPLSPLKDQPFSIPLVPQHLHFQLYVFVNLSSLPHCVNSRYYERFNMTTQNRGTFPDRLYYSACPIAILV